MSRVNLGEVARESKLKAADGEQLPTVGLEHLDPGDVELHRWDESKESTFTKRFLPGQVLFGRRRAYLQKAVVAPFEGVCSGDITVIEAIAGKISERLLPFVVQNPALFDFAVEKSAGSLSPRVKWARLSEFEFDLPSESEQEELANTLWASQRVKSHYRALIQASDDLVKSRFIEMFGTQYEFAKWDVARVEDVADVTVGVVIKPAQYYVEDSSTGIKAFRSLNVGPMKIKDADWVYFSAEGNKKNSKSILQEGDVLIVRSGYPGTSCVVPAKYAGSNAIDLIIARPNMAVIEPGYLCAFNNYPHGQQQIQQGVGGAAQQHFNVGKYKKMKIPVPPINLQRGFVSFANQVNKSKFALQKTLDDLDAMTRKLMSEELGLGNV